MIEFDIGSFVQFNGRLCSIIALVNGIAKLSNGQMVACEQFTPIEIGNPLDKQITLVCYNLRYPAGDIKTESIKYYQNCYLLQDKTINDVLKENPSIRYLHELQNWLLINTEDFRLVNKYGHI